MNLELLAVAYAHTRQTPSREFNIIWSRSTWTLPDISAKCARNSIVLKILYLSTNPGVTEINNLLIFRMDWSWPNYSIKDLRSWCLGVSVWGLFSQNISVHIEANHVSHPSVVCNICQKSCSTRDALRKHVHKYHRDRTWINIFFHF